MCNTVEKVGQKVLYLSLLFNYLHCPVSVPTKLTEDCGGRNVNAKENLCSKTLWAVDEMRFCYIHH